jgi:hypothetical protein
MKSSKFRLFLLAVIISILAGCAGSQLVTKKPIEGKLGSFSTLYFMAEPDVAEDVSKEITQLEERVISKLKKKGLFKDVQLGDVADSSAGTLQIKATISEIKKVSGTQRFFGGAFAGKAYMLVEVAFIDVAAGKTIGSYSIKGKSGGTGMSGGTGEAIWKTGDAIVDLISNNY